MDIAAISSAISSVKAATELAKIIRDASKSLDKAEMNMKLADLIDALAQAKVNLADVKLELLERDSQIKSLQGQLKLQGEMTWEDPVYYLVQGDKRDGPFCQPCWDENRALSRLTRAAGENLMCKVCRKLAYVGSWEPKPRPQRGRGGRGSPMTS